MWNTKEYNFGNSTTNVTLRYSFTHDGSKGVQEIEPLCNCTSAKLNGNSLDVAWNTPKNIVKSYQSTKVIMIVYDDGSIDDLTLKAYLVK